jgi:hypothetical protein
LLDADECTTGNFDKKYPGHWRTYPNVPKEAYKPTTAKAGEQRGLKVDQMPYFLTLDRCSSHSFWLKHNKEHLKTPGVPLLQLLKMPARGHDVHQIVEHAVGCIKNHVYKELAAARAQGRELKTELIQKVVKDGSKKYTAASWEKNLIRLKECLKIVSADKGTPVTVWQRDRSGNTREVTVVAVGGAYCPPARS